MNHSEPLLSLLERCTARILLPKQRGTGFFVAPALLLTSAHVVSNAQDNTVAITVQWEEQLYTAKIERLYSDPYPDLALLRVANVPTTHPCVFLDGTVTLDDELYCYGYPISYAQGDLSLLKFEDMTTSSSSLLNLQDGQVQHDFSGSPLLNRHSGGVCGMVNLTRGENALLDGRAMSIQVALERVPELAEAQKEFHQRDSRWYDILSEQQRILLGFSARQKPASAIEVYYSFAKDDEKLAQKLQTHLTLLKQRGLIIEWNPGEVEAGAPSSKLNRQHLSTAHLILLLISPDFLLEKHEDQQNPGNFEVTMAMERSEAGAIVMPILLRPVSNLDLAPFSDLTRFPRNGRPIVEWKNIDAAFAEIAGEIRKIVEKMKECR